MEAQASVHAGHKRSRRNVAQACENCRRRRAKCDGVQPECSTCKGYKDECTWSTKADARKHVSRKQTDALRQRIADLERTLAEKSSAGPLGVGDSGPGPSTAAPPDSLAGLVYLDDMASDGSASASEDEHHQDEGWTLEHMVENETGAFLVHGPTSAFHHINRAPSVRSPPGPDTPSRNKSIPAGKAKFSRYLPPGVLLTETQHSIVFDRFCRYHASWCQRITKQGFENDLQIALTEPTFNPSRTPHYSPLLHNAILSIALGYADEEYLRYKETRKLFAAEAKKYIDEEAANPSIATVQGLACLSSFHSLEAEHNVGWNYMGQASRLAKSLGLHIDCQPMVRAGKMTSAEAQSRTVTYWTTVVQEVVWSPYIGRAEPQSEYTTKPPVVNPHTDAAPWGLTGHASQPQTVDPGPSMISTTFVETVKLMRIGHTIMSTLYSIRVDLRSLSSSGFVSKISLALNTWKDQLPTSVSLTGHTDRNAYPHIIMMHCAWSWLSILLYRPFYRVVANMPGLEDPSNIAVKECDRAASRIVSLLKRWNHLHDLRFNTPTLLQVAFTAGTTFLLSAVQSRGAKKKQLAYQGLSDCIDLLGAMGRAWPAAIQKAKVLQDLATEYGVEALDTDVVVVESPEANTARSPIGNSISPNIALEAKAGHSWQTAPSLHAEGFPRPSSQNDSDGLDLDQMLQTLNAMAPPPISAAPPEMANLSESHFIRMLLQSHLYPAQTFPVQSDPLLPALPSTSGRPSGPQTSAQLIPPIPNTLPPGTQPMTQTQAAASLEAWAQYVASSMGSNAL